MGFLKQAIIVIILAVILNRIPSYFQPKLPTVSEGQCHPEFKELQDKFRRFLDNGELKGGSYSVFYKGEAICDLWGGYADVESAVPWQKDTISIAYSSTKGVGAILAAYMVDKGWLDYDKLISHYWPEFSQNGKDNITVRMFLSHQAGLSIIEPVTMKMVRNDDKALEDHLARQKPYWPPGTVLDYHAMTYGLYLDRLLRKVDPKHRRVDDIFREEIAKPLGVDFMIGATQTEHYRIARSYPVSLTDMLSSMFSSKFLLTVTLSMLINPDTLIMQSGRAVKDYQSPNHPDVRLTPITSAGGFGNARSLAKLYGILANGGMYNGNKIISDKTLEKLSTVVVHKEMKNLQQNMTVGHGFFLGDARKGGHRYGTPGYGGQYAFADPGSKVGMGFVTNHLGARLVHPVMLEMMDLFYQCLEKYESKQK